jgi:hypothetical protein
MPCCPTLYRIGREPLAQLIPEDCKYHRYRLADMLVLAAQRASRLTVRAGLASGERECPVER